jgi:2-polyprenyl-3-methyl-5-hydroxy-6-metoxy-1,4-benzoquinol methylase
MTTDMRPNGTATERDALVDRLVDATVGSMETFSVYLGLRLGLYAALAEGGAATPAQLSAWSGVDARYTREWLEQQAVAGFVTVDDPRVPADDRTYRLPEAHREVLLDELSPAYAGPLTYFAGSVAGVLPDLLDAYRSGRGVPFADYGPDMRDHVEQLNRPMFVNDLATEWLPKIPELHQRLLADPPARVADLACGCGWSSIAIARGYPNVSVDGIDMDEASVIRAREHAAEAGLADRVTFTVADLAGHDLDRSYDAAFMFEALHDLARPVDALGGIRRRLRKRGVLVVAEERVAEQFTVPGDQMERIMYGFSILHCLPAGRVTTPSAATGTALRPAAVAELAAAAGFGSCDVLPIDHEMWRFYLLVN